jgi:hypothetical protein
MYTNANLAYSSEFSVLRDMYSGKDSSSRLTASRKDYRKFLKVLFVVGLMATVTGVPVFFVVAEPLIQAMPFNLAPVAGVPVTIVQSTNHAVVSGTTGDLVWWLLTHWGVWPSVNALASAVAGALTAVGLGFLAPSATAIATTIISVGATGEVEIAGDIVLLAGTPIGWTIAIAAASIIVSF